MDDSFHYMSMINHMTIQKKLMEQLKDTGLTLGQPKVLDYLKDHDGASQKEIGRMSHRGRIFNVHFEPYGRKRSDRKKNAQWKPSYFSYFYDRIRKEKSEACGGGF